MTEYLEIPPADLLIDAENPRLPVPNEGQREALRSMAKNQPQKLVVLARDIVAEGGLSPSELLIVTPFNDDRKNRYKVLEGNRRLSALRALENPELLDGVLSAAVLKQLRDLSKEYLKSPVDAVYCCVVPDAESARHWIELRHTGENQGAGTVAWGANESTRFRERGGGARELHSQALSFLEESGYLTPEERSAVPVTSLKRLLSTPDVRQKLGLDLKDGRLLAVAAAEKIAKALDYVVRDLVDKDGIKTADIYNADQRKEYAKKLPRSVVAKATLKKGKPLEPAAGQSRRGAKKKAAGSRRRPKKPRDRLIPSDCVLTIPDQRISDIERELRSLSLENHTNAVGVLLRVFVELSVDDYIDSNGLMGSQQLLNSKLSAKIKTVVGHLEKANKITRQQAAPVKKAGDRNSWLGPSVTIMNEYIHSKYMSPVPSELRQHWDGLQAFMTAIWS